MKLSHVQFTSHATQCNHWLESMRRDEILVYLRISFACPTYSSNNNRMVRITVDFVLIYSPWNIISMAIILILWTSAVFVPFTDAQILFSRAHTHNFKNKTKKLINLEAPAAAAPGRWHSHVRRTRVSVMCMSMVEWHKIGLIMVQLRARQKSRMSYRIQTIYPSIYI